MVHHHGIMDTRGVGEKMLDCGTGAADTASLGRLLNPGRANRMWGELIDTPKLAAAIMAGLSDSKPDWRIMGLIVTLLDMQREAVLTQPSGVDWAWARRQAPVTSVKLLSELHQWGYEGVLIDTSMLEYSFARGGGLQVNRVTRVIGNNGQPVDRVNTETWDLKSDHVRVIAWADNERVGNIGQDTWLLSHLSHPLAWVLDTMTMRTTGERQAATEVFVRTAGLVDIHCKASKLVFVQATKTQTMGRIGRNRYPVATTNRHGEATVDDFPEYRI